MVDTGDLKSPGSNTVPVRVRSPAPKTAGPSRACCFCRSGSDENRRFVSEVPRGQTQCSPIGQTELIPGAQRRRKSGPRHQVGASSVSLAPTFFKSQSALTPLLRLFSRDPLVLGSRYVSLGSVVTVLVYPVLLKSLSDAVAASVPNTVPYGVNVLVAMLIAALVTWAHRGNLVRIMNHTERKLNLGKKKAAVSAPAEKED